MRSPETKTLIVSELDLFFLSYDEPNADALFAELVSVAPWAKRIHGVKGWGAVHRKAAEESETPMFITIDGDNSVRPEFFDMALHLPPHLQGKALSWNAVNIVNNLCYGNGGVKIWPKDKVSKMENHEFATTDENKTEFCFEPWYVQLQNIMSTTCPNCSAEQAWRAGYREGVKMALDRGRLVPPQDLRTRIWHGNLHRLMIWCTVGSDIPFGDWCIYGALEGLRDSTFLQESPEHISDIDWLKQRFTPLEHLSVDDMKWRSTQCRVEILDATGIVIPEAFSESQSEFVKRTFIPIPKQSRNALLTEEEAKHEQN